MGVFWAWLTQALMSIIRLNASSAPLSCVTGCLRECHTFMGLSLCTHIQFYPLCGCACFSMSVGSQWSGRIVFLFKKSPFIKLDWLSVWNCFQGQGLLNVQKWDFSWMGATVYQELDKCLHTWPDSDRMRKLDTKSAFTSYLVIGKSYPNLVSNSCAADFQFLPGAFFFFDISADYSLFDNSLWFLLACLDVSNVNGHMININY